jgi:hypothetical protein
MIAGPDSTSSADLHAMVAEIKAEAAPFWEAWDTIDCEEIYHYTSLDAARKILGDRILWASDVLSMNDTSEFKHAVSIVDDELMSRWNQLPIHFAEYFRPREPPPSRTNLERIRRVFLFRNRPFGTVASLYAGCRWSVRWISNRIAL